MKEKEMQVELPYRKIQQAENCAGYQ